MTRALIVLAVASTMTTTVFAGTVTPVEVARQLEAATTAPFLLDVRTPEEFAEGRAPGAINIPVQQLESRLGEVPKDRPVVVYCQSGSRAALASRRLREQGYKNVSEMQGSLSAWRAAQLPLEK